ncbi:hypothetical protein CLOM_g17640 [Closterium sp. NIES-68]|nr:hypothetical protein CLOM_g17640 [Closterium sp. NIES-68]
MSPKPPPEQCHTPATVTPPSQQFAKGSPKSPARAGVASCVSLPRLFALLVLLGCAGLWPAFLRTAANHGDDRGASTGKDASEPSDYPLGAPAGFFRVFAGPSATRGGFSARQLMEMTSDGALRGGGRREGWKLLTGGDGVTVAEGTRAEAIGDEARKEGEEEGAQARAGDDERAGPPARRGGTAMELTVPSRDAPQEPSQASQARHSAAGKVAGSQTPQALPGPRLSPVAPPALPPGPGSEAMPGARAVQDSVEVGGTVGVGDGAGERGGERGRKSGGGVGGEGGGGGRESKGGRGEGGGGGERGGEDSGEGRGEWGWRWVDEGDTSWPLYSAASCPFIFPGQNCRSNGRHDTRFERYAWRQREEGETGGGIAVGMGGGKKGGGGQNVDERSWCDALGQAGDSTTGMGHAGAKGAMMARVGHAGGAMARVAFVGDSMMRNMFESMACMLHARCGHPQVVRTNVVERILRWGQPQCNVTLANLRSNFLANITFKDPTNEFKGATLDLSQPDNRWKKRVKEYDVFVVNSGHWWTRGKLSERHVSFSRPDKSLAVLSAYRKAIRTTLHRFASRRMTNKTVIITTSSPNHFSHKPSNPRSLDSTLQSNSLKLNSLESPLSPDSGPSERLAKRRKLLEASGAKKLSKSRSSKKRGRGYCDAVGPVGSEEEAYNEYRVQWERVERLNEVVREEVREYSRRQRGREEKRRRREESVGIGMRRKLRQVVVGAAESAAVQRRALARPIAGLLLRPDVLSRGNTSLHADTSSHAGSQSGTKEQGRLHQWQDIHSINKILEEKTLEQVEMQHERLQQKDGERVAQARAGEGGKKASSDRPEVEGLWMEERRMEGGQGEGLHAQGGRLQAQGESVGEVRVEGPRLEGAWVEGKGVEGPRLEGARVVILEVAAMSLMRHDGHPGGFSGLAGEQADCAHWCLPGVPDAWNEQLLRLLC